MPTPETPAATVVSHRLVPGRSASFILEPPTVGSVSFCAASPCKFSHQVAVNNLGKGCGFDFRSLLREVVIVTTTSGEVALRVMGCVGLCDKAPVYSCLATGSSAPTIVTGQLFDLTRALRQIEEGRSETSKP